MNRAQKRKETHKRTYFIVHIRDTGRLNLVNPKGLFNIHLFISLNKYTP